MTHASPTHDVACAMGCDYTMFNNSGSVSVNKLIVGNAWGKVTQGGSRSASADAFFDGGDNNCSSNEYVGYAYNDRYLELYITPVISMDSATDYTGWYFYYLESVKEYTTTNCSGSYTSYTSGSANTDTNAIPGVGSGQTMRTCKQADFDGSSGVYNTPHTYIGYSSGGSPKTGYRSYYYKIRTKVCTDSINCGTSTETSDDGCFYLYWIAP